MWWPSKQIQQVTSALGLTFLVCKMGIIIIIIPPCGRDRDGHHTLYLIPCISKPPSICQCHESLLGQSMARPARDPPTIFSSAPAPRWPLFSGPSRKIKTAWLAWSPNEGKLSWRVTRTHSRLCVSGKETTVASVLRLWGLPQHNLAYAAYL